MPQALRARVSLNVSVTICILNYRKRSASLSHLNSCIELNTIKSFLFSYSFFTIFFHIDLWDRYVVIPSTECEFHTQFFVVRFF